MLQQSYKDMDMQSKDLQLLQARKFFIAKNKRHSFLSV